MTLRDQGSPSDVHVFHSVAATVRALAQAGRVVMVGVGSGHITLNMPGGVHIRVVADLEYRIRTMMKLLGAGRARAAAEVKRRDENRAAFFKKFFPDSPLTADRFTMTLNASLMSEKQMVEAVVAVLTTRLRGK